MKREMKELKWKTFEGLPSLRMGAQFYLIGYIACCIVLITLSLML